MPEDERLIARLVASEQVEVVFDAISLAFRSAEYRFRQSGAIPWVTKGTMLRPPEDELKRKIGWEIEASMRHACFALGWARGLGGIRPEFRSRLRHFISEQRALHWFIGWIDVGIGYSTPGLSGWLGPP